MKLASGIVLLVISGIVLFLGAILAFAWFLPGPTPFIADDDDFEDWGEDIVDEYDEEEDMAGEFIFVKAEIDERAETSDWYGDDDDDGYPYKYRYSFDSDSGFVSDTKYEEGSTVAILVVLEYDDDLETIMPVGRGLNHWFGSISCCCCLTTSFILMIVAIVMIVMGAMKKKSDG